MRNRTRQVERQLRPERKTVDPAPLAVAAGEGVVRVSGPRTREEAQGWRYSSHAFGRRVCPYYDDNCAEELPSGYQCARKPGHGRDGLRCRQHAKKEEQ